MITIATSLLCTKCGEVLEFEGEEELRATCLKCGEKYEQVSIMSDEEKSVFVEDLKSMLAMYQKTN